MRGKIKFFSIRKGFGFICRDDNGGDVYFNKASLPRDRTYDPVEGDSVEFEMRDARLGPIAHHIVQIMPGASDGAKLPAHINGKGASA